MKDDTLLVFFAKTAESVHSRIITTILFLVCSRLRVCSHLLELQYSCAQMPWKFHCRTVAVKCASCLAKIVAAEAHLSTNCSKNYHLDCIPDEVKREAFYKNKTISPSFSKSIFEKIFQILERGKELEKQRLQDIRAERQAKRAAEITQLHQDCRRQPRVIVGHRTVAGPIIESSASFCRLVGASQRGRKMVLQEFGKKRGKCLFSGTFSFGKQSYPHCSACCYRPAHLELHLVHAHWDQKVGSESPVSCTLFRRRYEHITPMGAEFWPREYSCALREEHLEQNRTLVCARFEPCEKEAGGVAVRTMSEVVLWHPLVGELTVPCDAIIRDLREKCCLPDEEYNVTLWMSDGRPAPADLSAGDYLMIAKRPVHFEQDSYMKDAEGNVLPLWTQNLPGCSKVGYMAYLDINTAVEARIELLL